MSNVRTTRWRLYISCIWELRGSHWSPGSPPGRTARRGFSSPHCNTSGKDLRGFGKNRKLLNRGIYTAKYSAGCSESAMSSVQRVDQRWQRRGSYVSTRNSSCSSQYCVLMFNFVVQFWARAGANGQVHNRWPITRPLRGRSWARCRLQYSPRIGGYWWLPHVLTR